MKHKCPKCGSVIYSRSNVLCGVCGERLPDELLFSTEQREKIQKELHEMDEKRRKAREAERPPDSLGGILGKKVDGPV